MTVRLYLIRHGETEWSLSGQHTGRTDLPLTAHGEDEARALIPWLRPIQFARVLTSPLQRARRTCELAGLGAAAEVEADLAEWNCGDSKDDCPATSERTGRVGMSFGMVVPMAKAPNRFPTVPIG
jgi:broad specificity phosphatase PhoE